MAVLKASQIRKRTQAFTIEVGKGPDGPQELLVRRPDVRFLIYHGMLPLPLVSKVGEMLRSWIGQDLDHIDEKVRNDGPEAEEFLNIMLCQTMVDPRCVMTREEADILGEDTLIPSDMDIDFRERVVILAMTTDPGMKAREAELQAASRFPGVGPSEGSAPDSEDVRETAEPVAANP